MPTTTTPEARPSPFVPSITPEELARRNAAAITLLDAWEADVSSEQDQRETMDVLRRALGPDRFEPAGDLAVSGAADRLVLLDSEPLGPASIPATRRRRPDAKPGSETCSSPGSG